MIRVLGSVALAFAVRTAFAALLAPAETDFGRVGKDYASGESTTAPASLASAMLEVRKIVLRGLPSIEEEAGRVVSEVSEVGSTIDLTTSVRSSPIDQQSKSTSVQSKNFIDVPPIRSPGVARRDRLTMDAKEAARLDARAERSKRYRAKLKTEDKGSARRKNYMAKQAAAAKAWRDKHPLKAHTIGVESVKRSRLRRMAETALATPNPQSTGQVDIRKPVRFIKAGFEKRKGVADGTQASSPTASHAPSTPSDMPSSSLTLQDDAQQQHQELSVMVTADPVFALPSAIIDSDRAGTSTSARGATAEAKHKYEDLFNRLFDSGSPATSP